MPVSEEWLPVIGYELLYSVSSHGRVRRDTPTQHGPAGYILKPQIKVSGGVGKRRYRGYLGVRLSNNGLIKNERITSLVARAFLGVPPAGFQVNHIDGDKANNRVINLEYVSPKENRQHASRIGLNAVGTRHGSSKLTEAQVLEIRSLPHATERVLAARYGVGDTTIHNVRSRHTWRHVV